MKAKRKIQFEHARLNVLLVVFLSTSAIFIIKLFVIQVLSHDTYKAMAESQYYNFQEIPAKRGAILSADNYTLASTQNYYLLYVEPQKIMDKYKTAHLIDDALTEVYVARTQAQARGEDAKDNTSTNETTASEHRDTAKERLANITEIVNSKLYWAIIEHDLTPIEKKAVEAKNIEGVGFEIEPVRYYPEGTLAANVLGFVASTDKGEKQGYFGVEGNFNGDLQGMPGKILEQKDALGDPILVGTYKKVNSIDGRNVLLTINRSVQYIIEKRLKEGVEKYDAHFGDVVVMNPNTGEIIAMASYPTFDPANFNEKPKDVENSYSKRQTIQTKNLSISETYEPGSVMKPFTVASAIDLNKVTPETIFDDAGPVKYSDYYIDNWNGKHLGVQTIVQLLQKSNNIGAAWVGHLVGANNLTDYLQKFGFGKKTNVDLEGEDTGVVRAADTLTDIDLANISFGQGISATTLQVLTAFNALINGGNLYQPKIVSKIEDNGKEITLPVKQIRRVISAQTSNTMRYLLVQAEEGGESKFYNLKEYIIGGKTGTAQIPVSGKYDPNKSNATFIGYFDQYPDLSMIVRLNEPTTSIYAAETAVPLWMSIASDLAKYYGIAPDR